MPARIVPIARYGIAKYKMELFKFNRKVKGNVIIQMLNY